MLGMLGMLGTEAQSFTRVGREGAKADGRRPQPAPGVCDNAKKIS